VGTLFTSAENRRWGMGAGRWETDDVRQESGDGGFERSPAWLKAEPQ